MKTEDIPDYYLLNNIPPFQARRQMWIGGLVHHNCCDQIEDVVYIGAVIGSARATNVIK